MNTDPSTAKRRKLNMLLPITVAKMFLRRHGHRTRRQDTSPTASVSGTVFRFQTLSACGACVGRLPWIATPASEIIDGNEGQVPELPHSGFCHRVTHGPVDRCNCPGSPRFFSMLRGSRRGSSTDAHDSRDEASRSKCAGGCSTEKSTCW